MGLVCRLWRFGPLWKKTRGLFPVGGSRGAAPGVWTVNLLPDGTALVGGDKLWLVGPPPHRGQD